MSDDEFLVLSSKEIYILSGILGYGSVFGIESDTFLRYFKDGSLRLKNVITGLEKKNYIFINTDGTVQIREDIYDAVAALSNPDKICMITSNIKSKRQNTVYIAFKNGQQLVFGNLDKSTYKLGFFDDGISKALDSKLVGIIDSSIEINIRIEDVTRIQEQIQSFSLDEAHKMISELFSNPMQAAFIRKVISGDTSFIRVKCFEKKAAYYKNTLDSFVIKCDETLVKAELAEDENIYFNSISEKEYTDRLRAVLYEMR